MFSRREILRNKAYEYIYQTFNHISTYATEQQLSPVNERGMMIVWIGRSIGGNLKGLSDAFRFS